jgi:SAM-dependent methyltransferase
MAYIMAGVTDYEAQARAAMYLTAEWGDYLPPSNPKMTSWMSPIFGVHPTIKFYRAVIEFASPYMKEGDAVLDIGSATGRLLFELSKSPVRFSSLTGCELSKQFSDYARSILLGERPHKDVCLLTDSSSVLHVEAFPYAAFAPVRDVCATQRLSIVNENIDNFVKKRQKFDTVFCLNVIDRHSSPKFLAKSLRSIVSPSGVLCVVCSFDWRTNISPKKEHVESLDNLFDSSSWTQLAVKEMDYVIAQHGHHVHVYRAQAGLFRPAP